MLSATLTSKGRLVIPRAIREKLHLRPGARLSVSVEGSRIVLDSAATKTRKLGDWLPKLQVRRKLTLAELCDVHDIRF